MGEPQLLRESLEQFLKNLGAPPLDVVSELQQQWPSVVGPVLAEQTRPTQMTDGVLVVMCDDGAWASQIGWSQADIKRRFQQLFPQLDVSRVVARIAG